MSIAQFVNLYAEDPYFLTTRACWKVTQIHNHFTFKQDAFKRDFVTTDSGRI